MLAPLPEPAAPLADAEAARLLAGLAQIARGRTPRALSRGLEAVSPVLGFAGWSVAVAPEAPGATAMAAVRTVCAHPTLPGADEALASALVGLASGARSPDGAIMVLGGEERGRNDAAAAREVVAAHWSAPFVCAVCATRRGSCAGWVFLGGRGDDDADAFEAHVRLMETPLRLLATALAGPLLKVVEKDRAAPLSQSERDILAKLAEGMRPAAIAEARGASETTVRNQIARARRRMGARSDAEAVAIVLRRGLI